MRDSAVPSPGLRPRRPRLYETLMNDLQAEFSGCSPGTRLPAERELAERLGVSRVTLKQALVALEVRGLVEIRHGDGVFIREQENENSNARSSERRRKLTDILEARSLLEIEIAGLAAKRRTEADLETLRGCLTYPDGGGPEFRSPQEAIAQTTRFHGAVARATQNAVLIDLVEHLVAPVADLFNLHRAEQDRSESDHAKIYNAIAAADTEEARRVMAEHLHHFGEVQMPTL